MKLLLPILCLISISSVTVAQAQTVPAKPSVPTSPVFRDVPPNHWAFAAVQRLAAAGIIEGYPGSETLTTQAVAQVVPVKKMGNKAKIAPSK